MGKIFVYFWNCSDCLHVKLHMHYPHRAGIVNTSKKKLNEYPNYLILISPIGHQTVGKQMKLVLVIVQINTIKVYFQIPFSMTTWLENMVHKMYHRGGDN